MKKEDINLILALYYIVHLLMYFIYVSLIELSLAIAGISSVFYTSLIVFSWLPVLWFVILPRTFTVFKDLGL